MEVELRKLDARNFRHLQKVDRNHLALAVGATHAFGRDLAPAARRSAEIDHGLARLEQAMLVVDLH